MSKGKKSFNKKMAEYYRKKGEGTQESGLMLLSFAGGGVLTSIAALQFGDTGAGLIVSGSMLVALVLIFIGSGMTSKAEVYESD